MLADNGIEGDDVPKSVFLPEGTNWLDESEVSAALGSVSGSTRADTPGIHGLGLIGTSVNGTELTRRIDHLGGERRHARSRSEVQNQGESTENGIKVSVTVNGGNTLQGEIDTVGAGEASTVSIPLTPAPSGEATLEVNVDTVPGEELTENNEASYTVAFE